jgi:hypothetical protein
MSEGRLEDIFVTSRKTGRTVEERQAETKQGHLGNETSALGYQVSSGRTSVPLLFSPTNLLCMHFCEYWLPGARRYACHCGASR